jgi:hypothetical protein
MARAQFNDRVITVRKLSLADGAMIPVGTRGFVIEAIDGPERCEVECDLDTDQVLATVSPR